MDVDNVLWKLELSPVGTSKETLCLLPLSRQAGVTEEVAAVAALLGVSVLTKPMTYKLLRFSQS